MDRMVEETEVLDLQKMLKQRSTVGSTIISQYTELYCKDCVYRNLTRNFIVTVSRKLTRLPTPAVLVLRWTEQIKSILHNLYNSDKTRLTFSIQIVFQKMPQMHY